MLTQYGVSKRFSENLGGHRTKKNTVQNRKLFVSAILRKLEIQTGNVSSSVDLYHQDQTQESKTLSCTLQCQTL